MPVAANSLVSIVVRTTGRPTLARTLERIAAQTYRPLEAVVVDASGRQAAPSAAGGVPVVFVQEDRPLDRPRAANIGLDRAHGDAVLFLDEDDEIEAGHIADLHEALTNTPGAHAAYSQTRLVD